MMAFAPLFYVAGYHLFGHLGRKTQKAVAGLPKHMMPDEQAKLLAKYSESLGFSGESMAADAFNSYRQNRIKNANGFASITAPDGTPLNEKLKAPAAADVLKKLEGALALTNATNLALQEFNQTIAAVNALITDPNGSFNAKNVVDHLHLVKNQGHAAILAQHAAETQALNKQLEKPEVDELKTALGVSSDAEMSDIAKKMRDTLKTSQEKELAEFDKSVNASIIKLHEAAQQQADCTAYIATLYENNKNMRVVIDKLIKERDEANAGVILEFDAMNLKARFKGITLNDLPVLEAVSGRPIEKDNKGLFSMDLPHRWLSPLYYSDWKSTLKEDMMCIAQAVKAAKFKAITMSVEHPDPDHARQLAKAAYAAARESRFPADKITIEVNGKKMSASEIFKDEPSELNAIEAQARLNEKKYEEHQAKMSNPKSLEEYKDTVSNKRKEMQAKENEANQGLTIQKPTAA